MRQDVLDKEEKVNTESKGHMTEDGVKVAKVFSPVELGDAKSVAKKAADDLAEGIPVNFHPTNLT